MHGKQRQHLGGKCSSPTGNSATYGGFSSFQEKRSKLCKNGIKEIEGGTAEGGFDLTFIGVNYRPC